MTETTATSSLEYPKWPRLPSSSSDLERGRRRRGKEQHRRQVQHCHLGLDAFIILLL